MPDISVSVDALNIEVEISQTGPQGPQGDPGEGVPAGGALGQVLTKASAADYDAQWENPGASSNYETCTAGEDINAGRVVVIDSGEAFYFHNTDPAQAGRVFGITKSSATAGNDLSVQPYGVVTDAGFSSLSEGPVWAVANGQVSNTRPSSGTVQKIGVYLGGNKMLMDFATQITL